MLRTTLILLLIGVDILNAQTNWTIKNPFEQKNFIENKGQLDEKKIPNGEAVLFAAHIDGLNYYFTKTGYAIGKVEQIERTKEELKELEKLIPIARNEEKEEGKKLKYKNIEKFHELKWLLTNPNVEVVSENKVSNYYSYSDLKSSDKKGTIKANAYKKLIYKNIYPNTDIIFEFPKDSIGIKYSICLRPGADFSKIKFTFPGNKQIQLQNDNLEIESVLGKIIDHKPISYLADEKTTIKSEFEISGNEIGFKLKKYKKNKTVIIDPWAVTPNFSGNNNAFDVDYDNQGNVYAYGGAVTGPFVLLKYDSAGLLIWSYTPTLFSFPYPVYGDFAVDRNSNNIYLVEGFNYISGAQVVKINSNATQLATFLGNSKFEEMWRIAFSKCTSQAVIGGGGTTNPTNQTCYLDTNLTNLSPVQYVPTLGCCHDVNSLTLDNYGNCYQIPSRTFVSIPSNGIFNNTLLIKLPLPALLPITYNVNTNYKFIETASNIFYGTSNGEYANGYNGLTTSNTFVYSYDSYELKKWDGPTGNLLSNKQINYPAGGDFSKKYWGGISADDCGNLFLGDSNIVRQYDTALTLINSYVMPGVIIDVNISSTGILYVCGLGFVSTLIPKGMVTCHPLKLTTVVTDVTCGTLGSATVNVTGGSPPYTIVWNTSPPQYGTTISNVTPGLYTVTVTENLCSKQIEVDSITIAMAGVVSVSGTPTNTCYNGTNGSITTTVSGGTGNSYQYSWTGFPTDTANFLSNLSAGTYTVSVISGSCSASSAIIVSENPVIDTFNLQTMYCRGETTAILSLSSMGMAQAPYQWYNSGNVIPGANQNEFNALVNNLDDYTLTWHYGGCEYTTSKIDSIVLPALKVATAVNVFSPDNDGINDWFFPFVELTNTVGDNYFESYTLQIFDRWGNKVFETSESDTGWNGITSKNKKADNGVYYWIATGKSNCSEIGIKVKGFVTLVR